MSSSRLSSTLISAISAALRPAVERDGPHDSRNMTAYGGCVNSKLDTAACKSPYANLIAAHASIQRTRRPFVHEASDTESGIEICSTCTHSSVMSHDAPLCRFMWKNKAFRRDRPMRHHVNTHVFTLHASTAFTCQHICIQVACGWCMVLRKGAAHARLDEMHRACSDSKIANCLIYFLATIPRKWNDVAAPCAHVSCFARMWT